MSDVDEKERRTQLRIAAALVKHMSNTKWRKLFAAIQSLPDRFGDVGIKFINDDRLFTGPMPGPNFEHEDNFGECGNLSYAPFEHIEFVQIPNTYNRKLDGPRYPATEYTNDVEGLIGRLADIGSFPIQAYDGGIRIIGYEWAAENDTNERTS
jgi:hypothetical protein